MADDLRVSDARLADIVDSYPRGGLTWVLATELERLRAAGDALAAIMRSGSDAKWDAAIDAWQEARRVTDHKSKRKQQ